MRGFVAVTLLSIAAANVAASADWSMDREASSLRFDADYVGNGVPGRFDRFDVQTDFEPENPVGKRLAVTVDVASVDMIDPDLTATVTEEAWFDVAGFAVARFSSDNIAPDETGGFIARGRLELKGVEKDVSVPFTWTEREGRAIMRGELVLSRLDFGIGVAVEEVGDGVRVAFEIGLLRE